jgi:hypothetical protein
MAAAEQESEDKPALEPEEVGLTEPSIQSSAGTVDAPVSQVPASSGSIPPVAGADAEIARLRAHVEDLRRENGMLWDQVRHEREARIREIELLNGMIQGMRR